MKKENIHPATFSNQFIDIFYDEIKDCYNILDPFAGTGKIGMVKNIGYTGKITCNDLEPEYKINCGYSIDKWLHIDASLLTGCFDAIVTSPTYGNRMADSHNAKDKSKRVTYTHKLGRKLHPENTGAMQWGDRYKLKHIECYNNFYKILEKNGKLIINISDHIRKGVVIDVSGWHLENICSIGFQLIKKYEIPVKRMRFGANNELRVSNEYIYVFKK
jgi:hypothetical protein